MRSTGVVSWGAVDWGGLLAKRQHLRAEQQHVVVVDHVALLERRLVPLREKNTRTSPTTPFFPYVATPFLPDVQKIAYSVKILATRPSRPALDAYADADTAWFFRLEMMEWTSPAL